MVTVGTNVEKAITAVGTRPKWMYWFSDNEHIGGRAETPSGVKRLVGLNGTARVDEFISVEPIELPQDTTSPWRCVIYAPDGSYLVMNGLTGYPTIGTPQVRLSDNAPARAILHLPLMVGADNARLPTFAKWTPHNPNNPYVGMIKRGMELTVEYRDADQDNLTLVFRGRIFQISSGEDIEVTAYDRLMDLAQYSDQYQPSLASAITDEMEPRVSISGENYIYNTSAPAGTITNCRSYNRVSIDSLGSQNTWRRWQGVSKADQQGIIHNAPSYGGISAEDGGTLTQLSVKVGWSPVDDGNYTILHVRFYQFVADGSGLRYITEAVSPSQTVTGNDDQVLTFTVNVNWQTHTGDRYGAIVEWERNMSSPYAVRAYWVGIGTRITTSEYWGYSGGQTTPISANETLPEIAVIFTHSGGLVDTSQITVAGTALTIPASAIPSGPTDGPLTTLDKGISILMSYFPAGSVSGKSVVQTLLTAAGLLPDIPSEIDIGGLSYYTTSTYDYMTCVHELIRAYNLGLSDTVGTSGTIRVRPRHTISETPIKTVTTDPTGTGEQLIVSHNLTAHWMAEKATVAYITEDATTSGLALALETDDRLLPESLSEVLDTPLRQIITDGSMGTHQMMASAAGGKMVQLHTNVFEGDITLAGYFTTLWDLQGSGEGGQPISINVPEYDAEGTAIPTELELRDGVTILHLNNIRTADRSEVAQSMGLTADAISNTATMLPDTVYIFGVGRGTASGALTSVELLCNGTVKATQTAPAYLKTAEDNAGYMHYCAMFPPTPGSTYSSDPIDSIRITVGGAGINSAIVNAKALLQSQGVHVDIRVPK